MHKKITVIEKESIIHIDIYYNLLDLLLVTASSLLQKLQLGDSKSSWKNNQTY